MITFDQNGVATRESQVFFEQKKLAILNNEHMTDSAKASAIGDLYNQYGMEYGTFNRIRATKDEPEQQYFSTNSGGGVHGKIILIMIVFFGLAFLDRWLLERFHIDIGYIKAIESLMKWIFNSH